MLVPSISPTDLCICGLCHNIQRPIVLSVNAVSCAGRVRHPMAPVGTVCAFWFALCCCTCMYIVAIAMLLYVQPRRSDTSWPLGSQLAYAGRHTSCCKLSICFAHVSKIAIVMCYLVTDSVALYSICLLPFELCVWSYIKIAARCMPSGLGSRLS